MITDSGANAMDYHRSGDITLKASESKATAISATPSSFAASLSVGTRIRVGGGWLSAELEPKPPTSYWVAPWRPI